MERRRRIDREICALESELLYHIDSELCCLSGLLRNAEQNWLSVSVEVTRAVIDAFAKQILDGVFMNLKVLDGDSAIQYVTTNFRDHHAMLKKNYSDSDFDSDLVHAILNAECLSSKINFLNRLKAGGFLYLSGSVRNLYNPRSEETLKRFKYECKCWLDDWKPKGGKSKDGNYLRITSSESEVALLSLNMMRWIEQIESVTDAKRAEEILLSTYNTKMARFEELRAALDQK